MPEQQGTPHVTNVTDLSPADAKWATLKKVEYVDAKGTSRVWEVASRKTRGSGGIDAAAIGNIIVSPNEPARTVLVIQYRPPFDAFTVEWPAGLIDADETPEQAARREFKEETGFEVSKVLSVSPAVAADPGLTNANLALVMVEAEVKDGEAMPEQRLDDGEAIERVVIPLKDLYSKLSELAKKDRHVIAAKLWHFAAGMEFMRVQKYFPL